MYAIGNEIVVAEGEVYVRIRRRCRSRRSRPKQVLHSPSQVLVSRLELGRQANQGNSVFVE